ncbi:MAG: cellulase family glycosylhydrolase [Thermomicrobiales bacterium]|nr:cellulase family glycosylhydrolase [Thermomicrobiales bacterium]
MEPTRFDSLARSLGAADLTPSRRGLMAGLAGGVAALTGLSLLESEARKKGKKKKKGGNDCKSKCKKKKGKKKKKCLKGCDNGGGGGGGPTPYTGPVFTVSGRNILDTDGDPVQLRGVNKMSVFDDDDPRGNSYFPQIAMSKSNTVRIVWAINDDNGPTSVSDLDALITNCRNNKMLPMIELHDATGNLGKVPELVDYWVRNDVREVIFKHSANLLVNIANEAGDDQVTTQQWVNTYTTAVQRMRAAGIRVPLVIDAPDFGKNLERVVAGANQLLAVDSNLIFSVHPYWPKNDGGGASFIENQFTAAFNKGFALIIGEFSQWGAFNGNNSICAAPGGECDYNAIMTKASQKGFGWYAWEWGPGNGLGGDPTCAVMDMTTAGTWATRRTSGWAKDVFERIAAESQPIFG